MKIFITGSEGFIGSHLVESLIKKNHKIKAFTQYHFQNYLGCLEDLDKKSLKNIEIVSGDIRDQEQLSSSMEGSDIVINLAALIGIPYSFSATRSYVDTNIIGTLNLLEASKKNKNLKKIILTSTSEVYGTAKKVPITEDHPLNSQSPYAATKIASDFLGLSYFHSFNLPIVIARPFNTFGPRQSARAVIPSIIIQVLSNQKKIELGNINPTRDFSFVDDTVEGLIKIINSKKEISGNIINICTGREYSIKKVCQFISEITKKDFEIISNKKRTRSKTAEVERLLGSNEKAKKLINWSPKYVGDQKFKEALRKTIDWIKKDENLSKYKRIYNL